MTTKMFTATSSKCDSPITSAEAKYVTDILSSMANGDPITSYPMSSGGFHCGVTTATTPTLTPTTLANIEQTFIELQSVPVTRPSHDPHTQSGFVPPIVDPTPPHTRDTSSRDSYECSDTSDSDWMPSVKRARMADGSMAPYTMQPSSTPGRKSRRSKDEKLSPEEEERRRVRRERNKVAAAKCRQRRVDHTNSLERETELLEAERSDLQTEVQRLQQHVEQLQYILQAHQPLCKHEPKHLHASQDAGGVNGVKVKQEPGTNGCQTNGGHQRPGSLPLLIKKESGDDSCGVPISTPSSGIFSLGFDSLVDGSTGLTPVTSGPSCGSQAQRNNSEGSTSSGGSTTLISL